MNLSMKFSIIAFNLTVMIVGFTLMLFHKGPWTGWQAIGTMFLLLVLGSIAAGITFKLTADMK